MYAIANHLQRMMKPDNVNKYNSRKSVSFLVNANSLNTQSTQARIAS